MITRKKKNKKRGSLKNVLACGFLFVFVLVVIIFIFAANWKINQKRKELTARAEELRVQVAALEQRNKELKENISYVGSEDYLEQVAREQLDMKKPGEEVVVIQKEEEQEQHPEEKMSWWEKIKSLWSRD